MACYNKLGDQCSQRSIALTSNTKFFSPIGCDVLERLGTCIYIGW